MTKPFFEHRHYVWLAAWCAKQFSTDEAREALAKRMADDLRGTNPNFNRARFVRAACGKPDGRDAP